MNDLIALMPFAKLMGARLEEANKERVILSLLVRDDLCTAGGILHGGAIMALADSAGAIGAFLNLPEGAATTTTLESKTNFLGSAPSGVTVLAQATPVHIGKRTSVWQTALSDSQGKSVALIMQTQMTIFRQP